MCKIWTCVVRFTEDIYFEQAIDNGPSLPDYCWYRCKWALFTDLLELKVIFKSVCVWHAKGFSMQINMSLIIRTVFLLFCLHTLSFLSFCSGWHFQLCVGKGGKCWHLCLAPDLRGKHPFFFFFCTLKCNVSCKNFCLCSLTIQWNNSTISIFIFSEYYFIVGI